MTTIRAFIKRHPVLGYYALVFAISWAASSSWSADLADSRPQGAS